MPGGSFKPIRVGAPLGRESSAGSPLSLVLDLRARHSRSPKSVTPGEYLGGMEMHQVIGLIAGQIVIVPAAYAAWVLVGRIFHALEHRSAVAGWHPAASQATRSPAIRPMLGFLTIWAVFNTTFLLLAGMV